MVSSLIKRKAHRNAAVHTTRTLIGIFRLVCKAWRLLLEKAGLHRLTIAVTSYMWYNESHARFFILSKHCKGLPSRQQNTSLRNLGLPLTWAYGIDTRAFKLVVANDDALPYPAPFCLTISNSSCSIMNCTLRYRNGTSWRNMEYNVTHFCLHFVLPPSR